MNIWKLLGIEKVDKPKKSTKKSTKKGGK